MTRFAAQLPKTSRAPARRQAAGDRAPATAPPAVHDTLRGAGQPLDPAARAFMEPRFGHDFSQVRVHTDARASTSAAAVHSRAYTVGHDIAFAAGAYTPGTSQGRRLLAHELTHVVQQRTAGPAHRGLQTNLEIGEPGDAYERQADRTAQQVTRTPGGPNSAPAHHAPIERMYTPAAPRLMRQVDPSRPQQAFPDLNTLFTTLDGLRLRLRPEEFHQLAYRYGAELFSLLNPFGYKGSQATPEGTLKDFGAAYQEWKERISRSRAGRAYEVPAPISDEDPRQRMYQTAAGDPIAALVISILLFVEATVGRVAGFELDPNRAAAVAAGVSLGAQMGKSGMKGMKGILDRRPGVPPASAAGKPPSALMTPAIPRLAPPTPARPAPVTPTQTARPAPAPLTPVGGPAPMTPVRVTPTQAALSVPLTPPPAAGTLARPATAAVTPTPVAPAAVAAAPAAATPAPATPAPAYAGSLGEAAEIPIIRRYYPTSRTPPPKFKAYDTVEGGSVSASLTWEGPKSRQITVVNETVKGGRWISIKSVLNPKDANPDNIRATVNKALRDIYNDVHNPPNRMPSLDPDPIAPNTYYRMIRVNPDRVTLHIELPVEVTSELEAAARNAVKASTIPAQLPPFDLVIKGTSKR